MELPANNNRPLTTGEIAQFCHVSHRAVLKWVESGKLNAYRTPGNHSRISIKEFVRFLKEHNMPIPEGMQPMLKRILIVDDDRSIVHSLRRILLMDNKFEVESAFNGFEAGQKFALFEPDFIILDLRMPGLDGFEVCANIRADEKNKDIKILVISGMNEPKAVERVLGLGTNGYLEKPFSNEALQTKISQLMG